MEKLMDAIYPVITNADMVLPFYITGVGCQSNQEFIYRPSGFMNYQWAYCRSGRGILEIGDTVRTINEKCAFFFRSEVPHKYYAIDEPWEVQWLTFDGEELPLLMDYLGFGMWEIIDSLSMEYFDNIINNISLTLKSGNRFCAAECSSLLYNFLIKMRTFTDEDVDREKGGCVLLMDRVITFIEKNYSKNITLAEIASVISVTPSHLCRIFKKRYNMSVFKFLINFRIQKSKELMMLFPDMAVKEITPVISV